MPDFLFDIRGYDNHFTILQLKIIINNLELLQTGGFICYIRN